VAAQLVASRVVLSSTELVSLVIPCLHTSGIAWDVFLPVTTNRFRAAAVFAITKTNEMWTICKHVYDL
jgi:hypothetical protein